MIKPFVRTVAGAQQTGLVIVILALAVFLTTMAGTYPDRVTGEPVNVFLNPASLSTLLTYASFFAVMAVGVTMVIITGGIDLSVGSTYALSGVLTALLIQDMGWTGPTAIWGGAAVCMTIGLTAGLVNGALITSLGVHPFIITLGTMWVFRGIAFVTSQANSIRLPDEMTDMVKWSPAGMPGVVPVPALTMVVVAILGWLFLAKTVAGRRVFAVGGSLEASRYSGVPIRRTLITVYAISGLTAGVAAYMAGCFHGATSSGDATGYELYVIASAVVGGASLAGGKGSAISAMLGALLIALIQQSIRILKLDQEYEWIIIGIALVVAVVLDRLSAAASRKRLARIHPTIREQETT